MVVLDEDEFFQLTAYVPAGPKYIRFIPEGYFVRRRGDIVYVASFLPMFFYGVSGRPLTTWRQFIPEAGEHVILSRSSGLPRIPSIYWRRVSPEVPEEAPPEEVVAAPDLRPLLILGVLFLLLIK
ncbi:hypothetical protein ES703_99842 [subsurface metagenome]